MTKAKESEEAQPKNLYQKLVEVMTEIGRVEKRGWNDFHKYAYVMETDLMEAVRQRLADRNILLIPSVENVAQDDTLTTVTMTFTFIDAESNERHQVQWAGTGDDKGDKGLYKAFTGSEKYFLMKMFLISTGDDPESDTKTDKRAVEREQASQMKCPECGKSSAIIKGKEEYGGGWLCFKKKGGCGAKFFDDAPQEGEPTAEVVALREQIKKAMAALNEAGDEPEWTTERVNKMARENFKGKLAVQLSVHELNDLAQMFSQRLEDVRAKGSKERESVILAITSQADQKAIDAYMTEKHSGKSLEELTLKELKKAEVDLTIPF